MYKGIQTHKRRSIILWLVLVYNTQVQNSLPAPSSRTAEGNVWNADYVYVKRVSERGGLPRPSASESAAAGRYYCDLMEANWIDSLTPYI
jgi:hypothetical protein